MPAWHSNSAACTTLPPQDFLLMLAAAVSLLYKIKVLIIKQIYLYTIIAFHPLNFLFLSSKLNSLVTCYLDYHEGLWHHSCIIVITVGNLFCWPLGKQQSRPYRSRGKPTFCSNIQIRLQTLIQKELLLQWNCSILVNGRW